MASIADVASVFTTVLPTVATEAARTSGWVQRRSKLTGAGFVQTLVLGWLREPTASLGQLCQTAGSLGGRLSPQGLDQRFTAAAADCLEQVLSAVVLRRLAAEPVALPLLARFTTVHVLDSSTISLPAALAARWRGCGNGAAPTAAAVKLHVDYELRTGALTGPVLTDGRASDRRSPLLASPRPVGSLRLADTGFFRLDELAAVAGRAAYFLTRLHAGTAVFARDGTRLDLATVLPRTAGATLDQAVHLGVRERLPVRLLAVPVPSDVAATRRRRLRAAAKRRGQTLSRTRLALADWTVLATNVPATLLSVPEALVLLRARWQIELLFKLWKQHGLVDESRSTNPWRVLCECYAKLIGLVLQHGLLLACWAHPDRSLVQAAQTVRAHVPLLTLALAGHLHLTVALTYLTTNLAAGGRLNPRRRRPNTYQLLLEPPGAA